MQLHPTIELATLCATLRYNELAVEVRERVRYLLLDHLAVTIGGSILPSSQAAYRMVDAMRIESPQKATLFGRNERAEASWAAFVNGVAAHGLEMDDVENRSSLHPGVVVFPAALALAESLRSAPTDFYAAVVAGYEATLRVGAALNPASAYERGFHPTAVCGTFGATAASARLLHLSPTQTTMALGIAGSMASGSMAYLHDGAWTKRLHPGWSSHAGITTASLAAAGFTGPTDIFEGPYGFLHAYSSASSLEQLSPTSDSHHSHHAIMDVSIKPYACCRYMHGPIDCLLAIMREHHLDPRDIAHVRCGVLTGGRSLVADPIEQKRQPTNIVDAQFSMPYGAAVALLTGRADLSVFNEEWLHNPQVHDFMQKIECISSPDLDDHYPAEWRASAEIETTDGHTYRATIRHPLGDPHNSLSWQQLEARFHALTAPVIADERKRQAVIERVKGLDEMERIEWNNLRVA